MSGMPGDVLDGSVVSVDFERVTRVVSLEFQVQEALLERGVPTYFLVEGQETKRAFLRVLDGLAGLGLSAVLRRVGGRVVLRVVAGVSVKRSNVLVNWVLFFATVVTTFVTGYFLSGGVVNPVVGGAAFTVAILAVLGTHEMGHKLTARRRGIAATSPYFIPGPPPFGTFGAVIMQRSLPPNRDALFDVGAAGPVAGFVVATVVSAVGLTLLVPSPAVEATGIGVPVLWLLLERFLSVFNLIPAAPPGGILLLHPVAFAGWVGILVTMLNLLPAAMLDGGHVARSTVGEKLRYVLTVLSILYLVVEEFYPMAVLVFLISLYKHPGPLDDVSSLSLGRKVLSIALVGIFVLCVIPSSPFSPSV
jgi:membrane-associated protease RseP (regulator of RpoE activity)